MTMLRVPRPLSPGDAVSLVAPSGPIDPACLQRAITELEDRGFRTKTYGDLQRRSGYLAGTDAERAEEFNQALRDPDTAAILPVRGGYGAARIIDQLDYAAMAANPKLFCGFSDITALHAAMHRFAGVATFHGPNLQDGIGAAGRLGAAVAASYWQALTGTPQEQSVPTDSPMEKTTTIIPGIAQGPLVGGNLAVLCGLIGTPYQVDTKAAILLLEDIGEAPYRIDRMLAQLRLAGMLDHLAGVVLGQFTDCTAKDPTKSLSLEQVFADYFAALGVPVVANYPVGHTSSNFTVPLGVPVRLDAGAATLDCCLSPALQPSSAHPSAPPS